MLEERNCFNFSGIFFCFGDKPAKNSIFPPTLYVVYTSCAESDAGPVYMYLLRPTPRDCRPLFCVCCLLLGRKKREQARGYGYLTLFECFLLWANTSNSNNSKMAEYSKSLFLDIKVWLICGCWFHALNSNQLQMRALWKKVFK